MSAHLFIWYIFGLAAISGIFSLVFSFMAASYLSKHGIKINYWNVRFHMLKYLRGLVNRCVNVRQW